MSDAFVIEAGDAAAGVLVREQGGWRFFAAGAPFHVLDSLRFRSPREAERAAARLVPVRPGRAGRFATAG
jgi:hypothetical protein